MYSPLISKVLEVAENYGNDATDDPLVSLGHDKYKVREAVRYCRERGFLETVIPIDGVSREVGIDMWWVGGLTFRGEEELKSIQSEFRLFKSQMKGQKYR